MEDILICDRYAVEWVAVSSCRNFDLSRAGSFACTLSIDMQIGLQEIIMLVDPGKKGLYNIDWRDLTGAQFRRQVFDRIVTKLCIRHPITFQ
jgi:hypothetical protein